MKDIHDLVAGLQNKISISKLSGLGAIDAALNASKIAQQGKSLADLVNMPNRMSMYGNIGHLNMLKNSVTNLPDSIFGMKGIADLAIKRAAYQDHIGSLKGLSDISSRATAFSVASKSVLRIPDAFENSLGNILKNQFDTLERLNTHRNILSSFGTVQADMLSRQSWITTASTLAGTLSARNWEHLRELEGYTEELNNAAEALDTDDEVNPHALHHLQNTVDSILERLANAPDKEQKISFYKAVMEVLTIISILVGFYALYLQKTDSSNDESTAVIKKELKETEQRIMDRIAEISQQRVAIADKVNLRTSPRKKSGIIGKVQMGQKVTVITINHKWLFVTFMDPCTNSVVSGWVFKKYFEKL